MYNFSFFFIKPILFVYFQIDYPSLESGNAALNANNILGLIYFTSNYTLTLKNRINFYVNRYDLDSCSVKVTLDPTSK